MRAEDRSQKTEEKEKVKRQKAGLRQFRVSSFELRTGGRRGEADGRKQKEKTSLVHEASPAGY